MNKPGCRIAVLCALITCIGFGPAAAQQVTIYGKVDFGDYALSGVSGASVAAKGSWSGTVVQGDITQGAYKITGVSAATGLLPGMQLSGTGIPPGAVIVDVSGTTLHISKVITAASATGVAITVNNGNATLVTSHANGLGGNIPAAVACTLDSGIHYCINGATETPFPAQANASAATLVAGNLTVNADVSINKQVSVTDTLVLNAGNLTIPSTDSLVILSGLPIAGHPFNSAKHIVTAVGTDSSTRGWLIVHHVDSLYLFPVGTANAYLPATLNPLITGTYAVRVFEGITVNGQPGGTAFTQAQKATAVDAVWNIVRSTNDTATCQVTLQWPQVLEGGDFSAANHIGIARYATVWHAPAGNGDNTVNTATICTGSPAALYVGQKGMGQGRQKLTVADSAMIPDAMRRYYPNPVTDQLTIEHTCKGKVTITVCDLLGRVLIKEHHYSPKTVLRTDALRAGVYILQITDGVHTTARKFIKE